MKTMKKCSNPNCKEAKPQFSKNKTKKDGLNNQCKVCVKKLAAKRYIRNREKTLKNNHKWWAEHADLSAQIKAEWRKRNPEKNQELSRSYRQKNIERVRMLDRVQASKRRAWKHGVESDGSTLADLIELNPQLICYLCNQEITGDIHIDHVIPLARGGSDTIDNKALTHPFCNMSKGAKLIDTGMSSAQSVINTTDKTADVTTVPFPGSGIMVDEESKGQTK
jgi:5-methylcytosine-specific restriction endonuclease McrA